MRRIFTHNPDVTDNFFQEWLMYLNYWRNRAKRRVILALGGYDQHQVGYLMYAAKGVIDSMTSSDPALMPTYIHRVKMAISSLDPELAKCYGFCQAQRRTTRGRGVLGLE